GIQQILVTGHSLGGAMVQEFLSFPIAGINPNIETGYTFGSIGADSQPLSGSHLVNFLHTNDLVVGNSAVTSAEQHGGYTRQGTTIFLDSATEFGSPSQTLATFTTGHQMTGYRNDILLLVERANDQSSILDSNPDAAAIRGAILSGNFWSPPIGGFQIVPG